MRVWIRALAEIAAAVAAATLAVAALESVAPVAGLGVLYLLAVLLIAIRRGLLPALATAVVSVLVLNFFFIQPRHRLTISDSRNVVALVVFLITAAVVGRLAADARRRAREADARAREASAREHESNLLAGTASVLLAGERHAPLESLSVEVPGADARVEIRHAPSPRPGELAVPLPTREHAAWLYLREQSWTKQDGERIAAPLADLLDVELRHRRLAGTAADAEAARRAEVAKTAILHAISHDLRSPLTAIATAASALRSGELSDLDRSDLLGVVEGETSRLDRLVSDLLALSRIEAGAVNPRPDWCDLHDTVASAAEQVRARHGEQPIELDLPADLPLVRADPVQMERVFANLIENAVKFSPPDAPVRVRGIASPRVMVRVTDAGRGIPAAERSQVFDPFYRGRDGSPGSGLGLAICRGFVEANGGRIQVQTREGEGTTFVVSFPPAPQPAPLS